MTCAGVVVFYPTETNVANYDKRACRKSKTLSNGREKTMVGALVSENWE